MEQWKHCIFYDPKIPHWKIYTRKFVKKYVNKTKKPKYSSRVKWINNL